MAAELEQVIGLLALAGEAAWPTVHIDQSAFATYLRSHPACDEVLALDADGKINPERAAEMWICAALAQNEPHAASSFDRRYFGSLASVLGRLRLADHEIDELTQVLRMKLLVRAEGATDLVVERYAGKGKLAGFIKVTATREAISRFRKRAPGDAHAAPFDPEIIFLPASSTDPGLASVKVAARDAFREGLSRAFRSLDPRERNLLRLHLLGGVTLEKLATMHGAHRATVVRWLRDARERVLERTRSELRERLGVDADEVDSLMGLATSHLDLTLERLLRTEAGVVASESERESEREE